MVLVIASAEHLPFRDRSFETVVSSLVFCSVPDPHRGLRELGRVLLTTPPETVAEVKRRVE